MKDYVVEKQDLKYDKIVSSQFYRYNDDGTLKYLYNAILADPMLTTEFKGLDNNGNLLTTTHYEIETTYDYDPNLNLIQSKKRNDFLTSYFWGYNKTYPVAKFDNMAYSEITSNMPLNYMVQSLELYSDLTDPTVRNNLKGLNDNIRSILPTNVFVNTYTYSPLVGITSKTAPNGTSTYYLYDSFGRLTEVKNDDGKLLKKYQYNYAK